MRFRATGARLAAGIVACAAQLAPAQDEVPPAEATGALQTIPVEQPAGTAPEAGVVLDDVVVTARRRKERAIDVPASMAVLDGDALGDAGLTLPTDIQERVAGLVVSVPNARLTSYTIRGLGSSSANDGIESSVGLFLDGIYLGRQGLSIFDLVDLDRVEVIRGPQGTLSGKNTTAGAINIVTKEPSTVYESHLEAVAGSFGAKLLRGSVNDGAENGRLSGRVTAYLSQRDGTVQNIYDGGHLNDRDKQGVRAQALGIFPGGTTGRFIAEYGGTHEACCAFPLTGPVRNAVVQRDAYMEYNRIGTDPTERRTDSDAPTKSDMRQRAISAEFNRDLGDRHTLTAVGGYRHWFFVPLNDDATSLKLASTSTLNRHEQYSQEIRLASHFDVVDSTVGFFWIRQRLRGLERVILGEDIVGWVFGGQIRERSNGDATEATTGPALYAVIPPESLDGMTVDTSYYQHSESAAIFGSFDWHLTDRLDLTTGLRYTQEWKKAAVDRHRYGGDPDASPLSAADPIGPAIDAAYPDLGEALGMDAQDASFKGVLDDVAGGEYARGDYYREADPSWQLALTWEMLDDVRVYAAAAQGFKGGGINLGFTGETITPTFRPERATSYEVGTKARLFDRAFVALTLYDTSIRDYQALTFDNENTLLPNPRQINLLNVGRVRLRGAELEGFGYALAGLVVRGGVAWSEAVTTDFPNAPNEDSRANDKDLSGERLYNAPEWSGNVGAEYKVLFDSGQEAYGGLDWSFRSSYWGTVEHGRASLIDGYDLGNLRAGLRAPDRFWDVSVWSRNILDKDYIAAVYPLYGVGDYGAVPADPRTFGITLRMELR
jgi:iron complex outermembrane recepter protein